MQSMNAITGGLEADIHNYRRQPVLRLICQVAVSTTQGTQ